MAISGAGMGAAASALRANAFRVAVSANNVANINTDGFQASGVSTVDAGYVGGIGRGTRVEATFRDTRPGAPVPAPVPGLPPAASSNTELAPEMTGQMAASLAYRANLAAFRAGDEMLRTLLDMRT